MLSGKHITFPELPRGSSFFDTKKHLRRGAHAYSFVSLTSDSPSHLQFCNICAYRKKLPVQTTDWQLRMSPNLWFFFSMATISSKFSLAGPLHPGCAAFHSSLPFENLHSGALILHQFGGLLSLGKSQPSGDTPVKTRAVGAV